MKLKTSAKVVLGLIVVVVIVGLVLIFTKKKDPQLALNERLITVGSDFYENFYFEHISTNKTEEEVVAFLERYEEVGIKVDIDNLSRYDEEKYPSLLDEFVNEKDNIACDIRNTRAVIYPVAPYGNTDYSIEAELDCGFADSLE